MAGDPILFINLFINLRGPEGVGNVRGLKIDAPLVHFAPSCGCSLLWLHLQWIPCLAQLVNVEERATYQKLLNPTRQ
jgi:hypothetical protein